MRKNPKLTTAKIGTMDIDDILARFVISSQDEDNTSSIVSHDPEFAKVYLAEKAALLDVLCEGDATLHKLAHQVLAEALEAMEPMAHKIQIEGDA